MTDREFNRINNIIWETSKCFLNALEVENDDLDFEFFYTPPESPSQPISTKLESSMNEDHGRRRSQILLDAHEAIVAQVVIAKCACKCPFKIVRKSLEKTLCTPNVFY